MKLFTNIVFLWLVTCRASVEGKSVITGSDLLGSFNTFATGVGKQITNLIPTPKELLQTSVQTLFGLPEVAAFQVFNQFCSVYLSAHTINPRITPDMDEVYFQLRTPCRNSNISITKAEEILENPDFDVNKKVTLFVTGWMSGPQADYVGDMANAYHCRGDTNFLVLDSTTFIQTLYTWSAFNTEELGRIVAEGLEKLVKQVPVENIHLIGHSLGAQIVGYAGRYFNELTGLTIHRITGLDPANPCFNEGESSSGLQRGDANFIDVIHSNPGVLGKSDSVGDADFFPEGLLAIKPGCMEFGCSHNRAIEFYTESVRPGNERNFLAVRCTSLSKLRDGFCNGPEYPMGFDVPYNLKGNYFLSVNSKKPYGKNNSGEDTSLSSECGRCESK